MSDKVEPGVVIKSGVREPMDMIWLSFGMNDDKNAVAIKPRNKCLGFTINIFVLHNSHPASGADAFHG